MKVRRCARSQGRRVAGRKQASTRRVGSKCDILYLLTSLPTLEVGGGGVWSARQAE